MIFAAICFIAEYTGDLFIELSDHRCFSGVHYREGWVNGLPYVRADRGDYEHPGEWRDADPRTMRP